jgi:hypothetical protein
MVVIAPKVLVPEKVSPDGLALLQKSLDVHERKGLTPEQLEEIIGQYWLGKAAWLFTVCRRLRSSHRPLRNKSHGTAPTGCKETQGCCACGRRC